MFAALEPLWQNAIMSAWRHGVRNILAAVRLLLFSLGLASAVAAFTPFTTWYARLLARPWPEPKGDILVVLGAESESGVMGRSTYLRCVYAVYVFRGGAFRRVVVSGAGVAPVMRDYLVFHGIPAEMVLMENRSNSTRENALFARDLLAGIPGRVVVVTSDYHTFRAARVFRRVGMDVVVAPFPDAIKYSRRLVGRVPAFVYEVNETAKIAYYFARGWI